MAKIDQYTLKDSPVFSIAGTEEKVENLQLTLSPTSEEGVVTGTVTTGSPAAPVANAIVKIFDTNDMPIAHAITNPQGIYNIPAVRKGTYKITACKNGFLTPIAISISISANRPTTQNITLVSDPDAALNIVYGIVKEVGTNPTVLIGNAVINVYDSSAPDTVLVTTNSNSSGQYLVPYLPNGTYTFVANKAGYDQTTANITVSDAGTPPAPDVAPLDLPMTVNTQTNTGTVNGFITYQQTPVVNAAVALYQVNGANEDIVQITKTNSAGRYLFGHVTAGNYIVKAFSQTNAPQS